MELGVTIDEKAARSSRSTPPPPPHDVRGYIEDQLDVLARLASDRGERRLAVALQMAALEAARGREAAV
jgi:hypothetical protein